MGKVHFWTREKKIMEWSVLTLTRSYYKYNYIQPVTSAIGKYISAGVIGRNHACLVCSMFTA